MTDIVRLSESTIADLFAGVRALPDGWDVNPRLLNYRPLTDGKAFFAFATDSRKYGKDTPFFQLTVASYDPRYATEIWPMDRRWNHCHDRWAQKRFDSRRYFGEWELCAEALGASQVASMAGTLRLYAPLRDQGQALVEIYRLIFPDWDRISALDGWPECNADTWKLIARRFMDFDHKYHPDVMAGGAWMNNGFSSHGGEDLPDWHVRRCPVTYQQEAVA